MERPILLYFLWFLALVAVVSMYVSGDRESGDFQGIADTREAAVNCEKAVEIVKFHVVPGQEVKAGDLLAELDRPELNIRINEISHELDEFRNRRVSNVEQIRARLRQLEAEKAEVAGRFDSEIERLSSRYDFNRKLAEGLESLVQEGASGKKQDAGSPVRQAIDSLKKERRLALNRVEVEMQGLAKELEAPESPETIRAQGLEKELALLHKEKENLRIYSKLDGVIGSVCFKQGEMVSPFAPILTIYTRTPTFVKGFIHENLCNRAAVGAQIEVTSVAGTDRHAKGVVVGVGSRIVEYPARLRIRPENPVWGREVQIRISDRNEFLLGERVLLRCADYEKPFHEKMFEKWMAMLEELIGPVVSRAALDKRGEIGPLALQSEGAK